MTHKVPEALEARLYRGQIGRRAFLQMAVAAGVALPAARALADEAEAARANQAYNSRNLAKAYDYIVVGSGSAGTVVASRLAAETDATVLLLEAGVSDNDPRVLNPSAWPANIRTERDWTFAAAPSPAVNDRPLILPMGKTIGGGSSINASVWARGHKADYDFWAEETGDEAWSYENTLATFRRIESWQGPADAQRRGADGPVWIEEPQDPNPLAPALIAAADSVGVPAVDDINGAMMEGDGGAAYYNLRIKDGFRRNMPHDYLYPVLDRPNITVLTGAEVTTLIIEGTVVTGVNFVKDGKMHSARANTRTVLSAGAINTPKILMTSGIGNAANLGALGINVVADLKAVGENLQDHVLIGGCVWEMPTPLPPKNNLGESGFYWKSDSDLDRPDIQGVLVEVPYVTPEIGAAFPVPEAAWTIAPGLMTPQSRGRMTLTSADPLAPVEIDGAFLTEQADIDATIAAIELCREVGNAAAMSEFVTREVAPGNMGRPDMENFMRNAAGTFYHLSCTCKMGRSPEDSVVEGGLSVFGIEGLTIADASVMPRIPAANTMAPAVIIGERAADILIG